jgi:glycosyltransferase involved in cell wall biosynthesis
LPYRLLAEAEDVEIITWRDPTDALEGVTMRRGTQAAAVRRVASGAYRAVICGTNGRVALPGSYLAARARRIPFVLWATMWTHPRTAFHALSALPTRHLYRNADAVVTYGPHVSAHVARHRARGNVFEAPQAVDVEQFSRVVSPVEREAVRRGLGVRAQQALVLYVGRVEREKGVDVLLRAWKAGAFSPSAVLAVIGDGGVETPAAIRRPAVPNDQLPAWYAAADVVVIPSTGSRKWLEPWGLVANEAMLQGRAIVATDSVGAARGGLVRDGETGLVVPTDDAAALGAAIRVLLDNVSLRERLGQSARTEAAAYTPQAWVDGMRAALAAVGAGVSGRDT